MDKTDHLKSDIAELIPALIVMRRDLHAHPELAFEEVRTSGIVAQRLQSARSGGPDGHREDWRTGSPTW